MKRVALIWVVCEADHFAWAQKNLEEAIEAAAEREVEIKMKFHISGASRSGNKRSLISAGKMNENGIEPVKSSEDDPFSEYQGYGQPRRDCSH